MGLYKMFSYNVEVQYKSYFLSKAMLFTVVTTLLNIILPFIIAYRSKGFWLKSHNFYEQPFVHYTYDYLLLAETEDVSQPILCSEGITLNDNNFSEDHCAEIQIQEQDLNEDGKNDFLNIKFRLNIPPNRTIASVLLILALDFQLKSVCPLHMQSLATVDKEFPVPPSGLNIYADLQFYQVAHLPCTKNTVDTKYNTSLFDYFNRVDDINIIDSLLEENFKREVSTEVKTMYSRSQNGHTGEMNINAHIRIPEMNIKYTPSLLQELKWAWPQYLSLVIVFYWIFSKIKHFVFNNRLVMAWEIVPWKRNS